MLPNEEFALACRRYYEEQGLVVDKRNGQFAHCPLPRGEGDTGYYLLWEHHQQQGLIQSRDLGKCCFFSGDTKKWLLTANYFPENYFELWDIYDEFARRPRTAKEKAALTEGLKRSWGALDAEGRERRSQKIREGLKNCQCESRSNKIRRVFSKRVEVTFPSGKVGVYPSLTFAELATGIPTQTLSFWARKEVFEGPRNGKYEGYFARYL